MIREVTQSSTITGGAVHVPQNPRLVRAAHEFEAQMMKELFKPLLEDSWAAEDGESTTGTMNALGEFGAESLAQGISEEGGLGIARSILGQLSHFNTAPNWNNGPKIALKNHNLSDAE